jgi:hypothetical protein
MFEVGDKVELTMCGMNIEAVHHYNLPLDLKVGERGTVLGYTVWKAVSVRLDRDAGTWFMPASVLRKVTEND